MFAGVEIARAADASIDFFPVADPALVQLRRVLVAALRRLGRGEMASLSLRDGLQSAGQRPSALSQYEVLPDQVRSLRHGRSPGR